MRIIVLIVTLVAGLGTYAYAQNADQVVDLSLEADSIISMPVNGYDGVVRPGRAEHILTASGNVVLILYGMLMRTDMVVWHRAKGVIELNGGSVRIELPGRVRSHRFVDRRR